MEAKVPKPLLFEDWVSRRDPDPQWVLVAQDQRNTAAWYYTIGVLAAPRNPKRLLSTHEWLFSHAPSFGHPTWTVAEPGKSRAFVYEDKVELNSVELRPLVFDRTRKADGKHYFEVSQRFILYYDLHLSDTEDVWSHMSMDGTLSEEAEDTPVVRVSNAPDAREVYISRLFLRDFLAATSTVLVRHHDHRRYTPDDSWADPHKDLESIYSDGKSHNFRLNSGTRRELGCPGGFSRLLGKDLVLPFRKPRYPHWVFSRKPWHGERFIIGIDKNGRRFQGRVDERTGGSRERFLTPVFFRPDVLKRYYASPSQYSVEPGYVRAGGFWGLPFDTNAVGLVHAWLGDLGHMPLKEQRHWRVYNVPPEGGLSKFFGATQLGGMFADTEDPIHQFVRLYSKTQSAIEASFGKPLWKALESGDEHIWKQLRVPLTNEQAEFDEQALYLAKVTVDSLNLDLIGSSDDGKSLKNLETFLTNQGLASAADVIKPFRTLQEARSSGAAHRKGEKYSKWLKRNGLTNLPQRERFLKLLGDLAGAVQAIQSVGR